MESKKKPEKLEIQLDEDTAQGVFSNLVVVNHNESEFVIDFIFVQPQGNRAKVRSRVVTTPAHVRSLIRVLENNLNHYEESVRAAQGGAKVAKVDEEQYH